MPQCYEGKAFPGNCVFFLSVDFFLLARFSASATMAKVQVLNVAVLDNPSPFGNPFQFEITFECMEDLPEGKERVGTHKWSVILFASVTAPGRCWLGLRSANG